MAKIYLAHSFRDIDLAKELELRFQRKGHSFTFEVSTKPFGNWREALRNALRSADVVIPLLTQNGLQSNFVLSEIGAAQIYEDQRDVLLAPIIFGENIDIPPLISDHHCFFLRSLDPSDIDTIVNQIHSAISQHIESSMKRKRNLKVFLCHASADKPVVENFYNALTEDGVEAWLDKKSLIPGQNWQVEIPKAVRNSDVVIVFLTSHSLTKEGFVQKEIRIALDTAEEKPDGTIFIIPARLEICEVPDRLSKFQWVDLFEKDGYDFLFNALRARAKSLNIIVNRKTQGHL